MSIFEIRSDPIEVTSLFPYPDMSWHFIDAKGHEHSYAGPDKHHATLPTLRWIWDAKPDDEYPGYGHYICRRCKDRIEPGESVSCCREFIAGPRFYFIDGEEVAEDEFNRRYAEIGR